jgi:hypothetical protein
MTRTSRNLTRGLRALVAGSVLGLAACSAAATPSPSSTSVAPASPAASAIATASASAGASGSESAQATAVPTSVDPCQLVTAQEVSALTGATFSAGQASTAANNVKSCNYGQEGVDFTVIASRAPDEATAKKNEDDAKAQLQRNAPGLPYKLEELPGFAPGADAAIVSGSMDSGGLSYSGIAIYVLKGTDFFAITDIATMGAGPPTSAEMQDLAKVALGRLP